MRQQWLGLPCRRYISRVPGFWEQANLVRQQQYRVIQSFVDADGDIHLDGEEWIFLGGMYSPYDQIITLCVQMANRDEFIIPLSALDEGKDIADNISKYIINKIVDKKTVDGFGGL